MGAIERRDTGQSVYGVKQYLFSDSQSGKELDFGSIIAKSTLAQAAIVEEQTKVTAEVLKLRRQKSDDLANALAIFDKIMANFQVKDRKSTDECDLVCTKEELDKYKAAAEKLNEYGYTIALASKEQTKKCSTTTTGNYVITIQRADAMRGQAQVQEMLDTENNNLQQDMMSLQGFIQKRDSSFSTATETVKKFEGTAGNVISAMQ